MHGDLAWSLLMNPSERIVPGSSIYINILHSLEGQDHDINYDFAFFVAESHYCHQLLWAEDFI